MDQERKMMYLTQETAGKRLLFWIIRTGSA